MRTNVKKENADPLKIHGFEGLCRVMRCREWVPDDEVAGLRNGVNTRFVGHTSLNWPQFGPTKSTFAEKDPM